MVKYLLNPQTVCLSVSALNTVFHIQHITFSNKMIQNYKDLC